MSDVFLITTKNDRVKYLKLATDCKSALDKLRDKETEYAKSIHACYLYNCAVVSLIDELTEKYKDDEL